MSHKKLSILTQQMENYVECWKQFNYFPNLARTKKLGILVQELELIFAAVEINSPTKEEVHALIGSSPSLRSLSEMNEGVVRNLENQWHKIYICLHSILGQLKVRQHAEESKSTLASVFGKKDK